MYLLIASTNCSKKQYGNRGSGSSLKNILSAPVTTWMSSHWLSSKFSFSSGKTRGEMEQLVLMKQLQDTNYYVNVCLLSSATVNSLLHLEVWCCAWFFFPLSLSPPFFLFFSPSEENIFNGIPSVGMQLTEKNKNKTTFPPHNPPPKNKRHKETGTLTQDVKYIYSQNASVGKISIPAQHDSKLFDFKAKGLRVANDDRLKGPA